MNEQPGQPGVPNFVLVNRQADEGEVTSLIPRLGGTSAHRLAELALLLPEEDAKANFAIILNQTDAGIYVVGMMDRLNIRYVDKIARILNVPTSQMTTHPITEMEFNTLLAIAYTGELAALVRQEKSEADVVNSTSRDSVPWSTVNPNAGDTAGAQVIDRSIDAEQARGFRANIEEVLKEGSRRGSSDMHFIPGPIYGNIFNRIDGIMYEFATQIPRHDFEKLTRGLCDMAGTNDYDLVNDDRDASIKMILPVPGKGDQKTRLRFSAAPGLDGIDISVRFINQEYRDFHEMGHERESQDIFFRNLTHRNGMILVTGETGSGKSTLLEAMTRRIEAAGLPHVIVLADPIEYENPRRTQIEITPSYPYEKALKIALRKDPNIIVIGEIRDEEVAEIAFHAAYTGHLVLTTLHTNDVASTFARLTNLGVKPYDQGGLIRCVCSQQLVRRLCNHCKEEDPRSSMIAAHIIEKVFPNREDLKEALFASQDNPVFFQPNPEGCKLCYYTGYKGRIAVEEVLDVGPDLANMISMGMNGVQACQFAEKEYGMLNFAESASRKLVHGITSYSEVEHWLRPPAPRRVRYRYAPQQQAWAANEPNYNTDGAIDAEYVPVETAAA